MIVILILAFIAGGLIATCADLALSVVVIIARLFIKLLGFVLRTLSRLTGGALRSVRHMQARKTPGKPSRVPLRGILGGTMMNVGYPPQTNINWEALKANYGMFVGRK